MCSVRHGYKLAISERTIPMPRHGDAMNHGAVTAAVQPAELPSVQQTHYHPLTKLELLTPCSFKISELFLSSVYIGQSSIFAVGSSSQPASTHQR